MTAKDASQVEPLTLTLEEALARIGERGYMLAVYHHGDAREYVLRDVYSSFARGSFGHWKDAVEAVLGVPVVPRDDTAAELVEALEVARNRLYGIDTARNRGFDLHYAEGSARAGVREIDAVLARVRSEP